MNTTEFARIDGLPPTTNHSYGLSSKSGRAKMYKTVTAKVWQELVMLTMATVRQQPHQDWTGRTISLGISIIAHDRRADVDGGVKLTMDAVAKCLGFNDKMVDQLSVIRKIDKSLPETTLVYVMEEGQDVAQDR